MHVLVCPCSNWRTADAFADPTSPSHSRHRFKEMRTRLYFSLFLAYIKVLLVPTSAGINETNPRSTEVWHLYCTKERLPVIGIRVSVIDVSQWRIIDTKITDDRGAVSLETRNKNKKLTSDDFILRISYEYEPVVGRDDQTPFSIAHENDTANEQAVLTEEFLLDEGIRRSGRIVLTESPCLAFVNMKRAMDDFRNATGRRSHPAGAIKMVFSSHVRAPFSAIDTILIPINYQMSYNSARHELAHTLRNALDGSYSHFLQDLAKYSYTQSHNCKQTTNTGFAFSEGWANYWVNESTCFVPSKPSKSASKDEEHIVEGEVASALYELGVRCHGPGQHRSIFYQLLEEHPLEIHSFNDFLTWHGRKYNCRNGKKSAKKRNGNKRLRAKGAASPP